MKTFHLCLLISFAFAAMTLCVLRPDLAWSFAAIANGALIVAFAMDYWRHH